MKPISAVLIALLLAACSPVKAGNPGPTPNKFGGMAGRVVAAHEGKAVALTGAEVTVGERKTTTDERGLWRMDDLLVTPGERVAVRITRTGYAPFVRTVDSASLAGAFFDERLLPVAAMKRIAVAAGGSIVVPGKNGTHNDAALSLPPKFLTTGAEEVDVAVAVVRPQVEEELALFPGDFVGRSAALPKGEDQIRTFGTMEVSFSAGGEPLGDVTLNAPAGMLQHLDPKYAADFPEGATIPTWWLQPETGIWEGEGYAKVVVQNGEKYASWSVKHFTWWNVDQPLATHACVALKVIPAGESERALLAKLKFTVAGVDYAGTSLAVPFVDGLAVANGWLGHTVAPKFTTLSGGATVLSPVLISAIFGKSSFAMPMTNASAYFKVGPGGVPLVPEKHCMYVERTLSLPTGAVRGKVVDEYGAPMSGAVVTLPELGATALSGTAGEFVFSEVPWRDDGAFSVTLLTIASKNNPGTVLADVPLVRDEADQTVLIVADPVARPPVFTSIDVLNTTPPVGGTTDFTVNVDDDNASLQWGLELCGRRYEARTSAGSEDPAKVVICHYPPGNRDNPQTVSVGSASVDSHLAHGDALGACPGVDTTSPPATGADQTASSSGAELTCAGTLTSVQTEVVSSAPGRNSYRLRGRWHGGATHGRETLKVLVKDPLGYVSERWQSIYLRNNAPVVFIDAPSYPVLGETVHVVVRASDPDGDAMTYGWSVNGVARAETGGDLFVNGLAEGPNYVTITVKDGEATVTQRTTLYVVAAATPVTAATAPETVFTGGVPPLSTPATSATIGFSSPDTDVTGYECALDGGVFSACTSPRSLAALTVGVHTFAVRAIDATGNVDPTPAYATWEVIAGWEAFSVGSIHTCAIKAGGRLACWGKFADYQVTQSEHPGFAAPVSVGTEAWRAVSAEFGVAAVAVPETTTCGVRADGTLWCWGDNEGNYLINSTLSTYYSNPVQNGPATDWVAVKIANNTGCALNEGGSLQCWGANADGRLSNNTTAARPGVPAPVTGPASWLDYSVGKHTVCGVASDRTLWCWGQNTNGEVGIGNTTSPQRLAQRVNLDVDWSQVSVGDHHVCAVKTGGSLWCWGRANYNNELGIPYTSTSMPLQVSGTGWKQVSAGATGTCAVKTGGTLHCWGRAGNGEFGNGYLGAVDISGPVQIGSDQNWMSIALADSQACGLKNNFELVCMGSNIATRIGTGVDSASLVPVLIDDTHYWVSLTHLSSHACGVEQGGALWCWGKNVKGEVGDGSTTMRQQPVRIAPEKIWAVAYTADESNPTVQYGRTCAIETNGVMWCWGNETWSNLGNGALGSSLVPVQVAGGKTWASAALGAYHTCAIDTAGRLYCWGGNSNGQAGVGNGASSFDSPQAVGTDTDWVQVKATQIDSCARKSDNSLYCWGGNSYGIHGRGNVSPVTVPTATTPGMAWKDFDFGLDHACGIRTDGTLWCWGRNFNAQVGWPYESFSVSYSPMQVGSANDWDKVFLGWNTSCAIKTTGTLWCWGYGADGALGIGPVAYWKVHTPTQVGTANDWAAVGARWSDACGIRTNGDRYCWGKQLFSEWGNGSAIFPTPQLINPPSW